MFKTQITTVNNGVVNITIANGILMCGGSSIALNKINTVNSGYVSGDFPKWTIVAIIIALFLFRFNVGLALVVLLVSIARLAFHFWRNPTYRLDLDTSSVDRFSIWAVKGDREKLAELQGVLMQVIGQ